MASRKMTFSLPDELAASFTRRVEKRLILACEIANQDPELREIEREFDALTDAVPEPWEDAAAR
jgi:hypothetical protein